MSTPSPSPSLIHTPDQRLRVFVSSTLDELATERRSVSEAIERLHLAPVMFEQGARPHPPRDVYRSYIAQSHVFVGVYAEDYGWTAPGSAISGIEDEYRLAADMPRLIYVKTPAPRRDPRLEALIEDIESSADVSFRRFTDARELRRLVEHDIAVLLTERFQESGAAPETAPPAVIPVARTQMFDRDLEIAALTELLTDEDVRLVTLTGPGGVGKTRLATDLAERLRPLFPDGIGYVELSTVNSPELVVDAIARALGLRTSSTWRPVADIVAFLRTRQMLLVVDNFEHVAEAAPVLADILAGAAGVTALVTSRSPVRISGEHAFALEPLAIPDRDITLDAVRHYGSVRLFVDRARAASGAFTLTDENLPSVVEICRGLEGLPLAIELAAAKIRVLPPTAILQRMGRPLELLTGGARDLPDRQRTLRDTVGWSYDLLNPGEQAVFRRLAVFMGGFTLEAADTVGALGADAADDSDVLDALDGLVQSSLIRQESKPANETRFRMLDSIREFALDQLRDGPDWEPAHNAHAAHYLDLALTVEPCLSRLAEAGMLDRLESEHDNLIAAIGWFLDHHDPESALRLAEAIWVFWWLHGHIDEALRYLTRIFEMSEYLSRRGYGRALLSAGTMSLASGDLARGGPRLERALLILREVGDMEGIARAAGPLGHLALTQRDFERARPLIEEASRLSAQTGDDWQASIYHSRLGAIALLEDNHDTAADEFHAALVAAQLADDSLGTSVALYSLALNSMGRGDFAEAHDYLADGLSAAYGKGDTNSPPLFIAALGDLDARQGDPEQAVRLISAAGALQTPSGATWLAAYVLPWPDDGPDEVMLRRNLGSVTYEKARRQGAALGLDRAVAEALAT
ncbi:hypothetical protein Ais01nite_50220 [Asanoa ishikariensis]|uniref:Predicted ATPase n=1 Tax=Asanoa ishikariensis TaxID=137265 RepID=A0A1H3RQM7_9ACTN|nr:DUF4062 domain-containing protein [Asanoa ishikariensis]GIF66987.1 hypothetical protein Ais01nite_50220 [Asanoa ishikariensis]SDZ27511.1 Predicted ATPase [Asanoa ishikariensis]